MTDLDQNALVEAKSAAMQALGYRHGDTVVIGNIPLNIGGAVQSAITAYLAALPPSPAVVPPEYEFGRIRDAIDAAIRALKETP